MNSCLIKNSVKLAFSGVHFTFYPFLDDSFQRMEAPNQFWEFADSYCREVTIDDLNALDKQIDEFRGIPDSVFSIPPLGKHFRESGGSSETVGKYR